MPHSLTDDERHVWNRSREQESRLDKSGQLHESKEINEYVNRVAMRLLPPKLREQKFSLKVKVIKNPFLNAFALSHGVVYVHSGFLVKMENEAQLATLLAHEIAHIIHRHPVQHLRRVETLNVSLELLSIASYRAGVYANLINLFGLVGTAAAVTGYSRGMELEADTTGLDLLVRAGYDPRESTALFGNLAEQLKGADKNEPFFFGSHPRVVERKGNYEALLQSRYSGVGGEKAKDEYMARTSPIVLETAASDTAQGRWLWAKASIDKYISLYPDRPEGHFHLAELHRLRNSDGELDEAEAKFRMTLRLDGNFAAAYRGLGMVFLKKGDVEKAAHEFRHYLLLSPDAKDRAFIEPYIERADKKLSRE